MPKTVQEIVREAETNYKLGWVILNEHVRWSLRDTIWRIYAYLNSRHISGESDSLGREKPFFNIVTAAVNIWFRATSLDRKDVTVQPDSADHVAEAFLANILLQDWMKRARFGQFLKQWGLTLAQYGSAVVKFVEQDGELKASVIPWLRLIVDPIKFSAIPTIEIFYMTPAELRKNKNYDPQMVEDLITAHSSTRRTLWGTKKDNQAGFIPIYEVHGEMAEALLLDNPELIGDTEPEWTHYVQQMHVVSFVAVNRARSKTYADFTLYRGKEAKHPYMITHLQEQDGRTLAIGAVEYLFDAQWMANHTMKNWKDQLDLASRIVFQTADTQFANRNVLTAIETGDILVHAQNQPLEAVPNTGHDITNLQGYLGQWNSIAQEITSTPDAMRGMTLPSATAYRQAAMLTQNANSFFTIITETKGLYLEDIMREYVLPYLKTKLNNKDEVAAILEDHQVTKLDAMYVPREAIRQYNKKMLDTIMHNSSQLIAGGSKTDLTKLKPVTNFNPQQEQAQVSGQMSSLGNQRFLSPGDITWKAALKDMEWDLDIGVTNEQHDKQMIMSTLSTVLQTIASNPNILQDPNAKLVFSQILNQTGVISPIQISTATSAPQQPQQGNVPMNAQMPPMPTPTPLANLQPNQGRPVQVQAR